jgi:hypothetical protein
MSEFELKHIIVQIIIIVVFIIMFLLYCLHQPDKLTLNTGETKYVPNSRLKYLKKKYQKLKNIIKNSF